MSRLASTPEPPYYAVIFTSEKSDDGEGYGEAAARMMELAREQPGFLGVETAAEDGLGITVSYWESLDAIAAWRRHAEHSKTQAEGRSRWYRSYSLRVARVERASEFETWSDP